MEWIPQSPVKHRPIKSPLRHAKLMTENLPLSRWRSLQSQTQLVFLKQLERDQLWLGAKGSERGAVEALYHAEV